MSTDGDIKTMHRAIAEMYAGRADKALAGSALEALARVRALVATPSQDPESRIIERLDDTTTLARDLTSALDLEHTRVALREQHDGPCDVCDLLVRAREGAR